jgi:flagellar assembly protein FliH
MSLSANKGRPAPDFGLSVDVPAAGGATRSAFDFEQLTPPAPRAPAPSLEDAADRARALIAAAEAEATQIREQAHAEGLEAGFAEGRESARVDLVPAANALAGAVHELQQLQGAAAERVEAQAVDLAMRVAERVVAGAIAAQPERLLDVVRGALRTLVERERVVVLVHPDDLGLIRDGVAELTSSLGGMDHLEVQEERRVGRGGAILRTSFGEVDSRLHTKLERAREAIEKELAR